MQVSRRVWIVFDADVLEVAAGLAFGGCLVARPLLIRRRGRLQTSDAPQVSWRPDEHTKQRSRVAASQATCTSSTSTTNHQRHGHCLLHHVARLLPARPVSRLCWYQGQVQTTCFRTYLLYDFPSRLGATDGALRAPLWVSGLGVVALRPDRGGAGTTATWYMCD